MQSDPLLEDQFVPTGELSGDGLPRDGYGRYILPHPVTGEKKGRTRVTTMSGMGSSSIGLTIDRERKVVAGMGYRPDLCARAAAAHSGLDTDPNAKKLLSEIAEAAYIQAGGTAGANYGTAQHAVFEQYFLHGVPMEKLASYFHADIKCIEDALAFHKLRILPQYIERVVYSILYDRGGKIDAIVEHIPTGDLYILDLKTEEDPIGHPENKTIQLAYYGNADCTFNYQTGQWEPMPKVRTDIGLIVAVRPGKGAETDITKAILMVPIDLGWVGVRAVEMMRAWRQQKIVIAPFITEANWTPPAPVNINGIKMVEEGVIPDSTKTIEQLAQEAIDGNVPLTDTTPQTNTSANPGFIVTSDGQPSQGCHVCGSETHLGQPHFSQCPVPGPLTPASNGVAAQVHAFVDEVLAQDQPVSLEQMAELDRQAAEVVANRPRTLQEAGLGNPPDKPPGKYVIPVEGVPEGRPPAPKSALDKMSAAEHLKQLLDVPPYIEGSHGQPGQGVNPEAEVMELAQLSKPRLQELITLVSGGRVPESDLKRHKKPLAEMLVPLLDQQRRMKHGASQPEVATPQPPAEVTNVNGFVDMSYEGIIKVITEAISTDQLTAIYNQIIGAYGPNGWHEDFNNAAMQAYARVTSN